MVRLSHGVLWAFLPLLLLAAVLVVAVAQDVDLGGGGGGGGGVLADSPAWRDFLRDQHQEQRQGGADVLAVQVAAGGYHTSVLTSDGRVVEWGLVAKKKSSASFSVVDFSHCGLETGEEVVGIAAGTYHTVAWTSSGRLFGWGRRSMAASALGLNSQTVKAKDESAATTTENGEDGHSWVAPRELLAGLASPSGSEEFFVTQAATGHEHTVALDERTGRLAVLGGVRHGALGLSLSPEEMSRLGYGLTQGPDSDDERDMVLSVPVALEPSEAWTGWASQDYGGSDDEARRRKEKKVVDVCAGGQFTIVRTDDGQAWSFGTPSFGALGRPVSETDSEAGMLGNWSIPGPVAVPTDLSVAGVSCGGDHAVLQLVHVWRVQKGEQEVEEEAVMDAGLWSVGWNEYGQLGLGNTRDTDVPALVPLATVGEDVAENEDGEISIGAPRRIRAVAGAYAHTLWMSVEPATDGGQDKTVLYASGLNDHGELGVGRNVAQDLEDIAEDLEEQHRDGDTAAAGETTKSDFRASLTPVSISTSSVGPADAGFKHTVVLGDRDPTGRGWARVLSCGDDAWGQL